MTWEDYDVRLKKLYSAINSECDGQSSHETRMESMLETDKLMEELTIALKEREQYDN